jgi:hypothetical protein
MSNTIVNMLSGMLDVLFGCTHRNYSFPVTPKDRRSTSASSLTGVYVVCLNCGHEMPYDWKEMKLVSESDPSSPTDPLREAVKSCLKKTA